MRLIPTLFAGLVCLSVASLPGCYMPRPVTHAKLQIAADGALRFNGAPVAASDLQALVEKARPSGAPLVGQIEVVPNPDLTPVRQAVSAIKAAHATVAFAKEGAHQ